VENSGNADFRPPPVPTGRLPLARKSALLHLLLYLFYLL